ELPSHPGMHCYKSRQHAVKGMVMELNFVRKLSVPLRSNVGSAKKTTGWEDGGGSDGGGKIITISLKDSTNGSLSNRTRLGRIGIASVREGVGLPRTGEDESEGAISRNEDVCEESGSRCLPSCSREAKALSSPWRAMRGTLDTRRTNRSGVNDDEIAGGFIYFVCVALYSELLVSLFPSGLNYIGRPPDLFGGRILHRLNYISAIRNFGVTKWNLKTFNVARRFLALCASRTEGRFHDLAASCVLLTSNRHLSFHDLARPHCPVFQDMASLAQLIGAVRVRNQRVKSRRAAPSCTELHGCLPAALTRARVVRNNDGALTACALVLHPDVLSVLAAGLPQVTMVRVGHVVGAADGIGSQRTIRRALTQTFAVFGHDARRAPGAARLESYLSFSAASFSGVSSTRVSAINFTGKVRSEKMDPHGEIPTDNPCGAVINIEDELIPDEKIVELTERATRKVTLNFAIFFKIFSQRIYLASMQAREIRTFNGKLKTTPYFQCIAYFSRTNALQLFSLQLMHRKNIFSAKGIIIDATLLTELVGGITMYIIILIQFLLMWNSCGGQS
ncbi:hypothetical protein ALC57_12961, partial [Trachymyrmex cornetzi]